MAITPVTSIGPQAWLLDDGARLHLQHGPIDLLIAAVGSEQEVNAAYRQANQCFQTVLTQLVSELPQLRTMLRGGDSVENRMTGEIAQQMLTAAIPYAAKAVTPMIAVAGSVADHILGAMLIGRKLQRVCVNNGGDIALFLSSGSSYRVGICARPDFASHEDIITLTSADRVGGVATSGWRGRSHSLGIADAVTVLARTAAMADAAATVIANAIDVPGSPRIKRQAASTLNPDTDLGDQLVTVDVAGLSTAECKSALAAGRRLAQRLCRENLISSAFLKLQSESAVVSPNGVVGHSLKSADPQANAPVRPNAATANWQQNYTSHGALPHVTSHESPASF